MPILGGVSFELREGEIVALLCRSQPLDGANAGVAMAFQSFAAGRC